MIEKLKKLIAEYEEITAGFDEITGEDAFNGCITEEEMKQRESELRVKWDKVRKMANAKMAEIMVLRQEIAAENERCVQFLKDCKFVQSLGEKFWTQEEKQRHEEYKRSYTSKGFEVPIIDGFFAIKLFTLTN